MFVTKHGSIVLFMNLSVETLITEIVKRGFFIKLMYMFLQKCLCNITDETLR